MTAVYISVPCASIVIYLPALPPAFVPRDGLVYFHGFVMDGVSYSLLEAMRNRRILAFLGLMITIGALCSGICLYGTFLWADTFHAGKVSPVFDVAPSGRIIVFNAKSDKHDVLFSFDRLSNRLHRVLQTTGSIEEICVINDNQAVLSVRERRNRVSSDIYSFMVKLDTGAMYRLTNARRVWEAQIQRVSSGKFIMRRYKIRIYLTIFGWEIYGIEDEKSATVVDALRGNTTSLRLSVSPYQLEQVLDDRRVILSSYSSHGRKWFLAELNKPLTVSGARVVRRQSLPIYSDALAAREDGRFFCYLVHNPEISADEIYCFDIQTKQIRKLVQFRSRLTQMRCVGDHLFFLSDGHYPVLWQVRLDGSGLNKIVDIGSLR